VFAQSPAGTKTLAALQKNAGAFAQLNTQVLALTSDARNQAPDLLHDDNTANARRFQAYDDFTDTALDATIFIDGSGRIRWLHRGAFSDVGFLRTEIQRTIPMGKNVGQGIDN
jgi:alkyl hydroperoxide reductase subunit AhpC